MAGETVITAVGNLTGDPELRFTASGAAVANFTVASTPRTFDKNTNAWVDGEPLFLRCAAWKQAAENVAQSLTKGMRVIVQGRLTQRSYETKEGEKRTAYELIVDEIGPSLTWATATVVRSSPGGNSPSGGQAARQSQRGAQKPAQDPWATPSGTVGGWGAPDNTQPPF